MRIISAEKMNCAQLLLTAILCTVSLGKVTEAFQDGHGGEFPHKISKRYALGRVPLSYTNRQLTDDVYGVDKRFRSNPAPSHFRELQMRQVKRTSDDVDNMLPAQPQSYRNLQQYYGYNNDFNPNDIDLDGMESSIQPSQLGGNEDIPLTDRELKTLLLLLEGYQAPPNIEMGATGRNFYSPPGPYYTQDMMEGSSGNPAMGKRETGKRNSVSKVLLGQEQPMSFENSLGDNYPVFLNQKRSKRIGIPPLRKRSSGTASVRIKKETDPKVEASLDKIFDNANNMEHSESHQHQQHATSIPTTAISSSDQIPAPASKPQMNKPKKAIDWSDYFGIDKRQETKHSSSESAKIREPENGQENAHNSESGINKNKSDDATNDKTVTSSNKGDSLPSTPKLTPGKKNDKVEKTKQDKSKQENDTEEKEDRKWILKEFYKNLAMSTNVKRKRESPTMENDNDEIGKLQNIEKKMEEAGDEIIWDALKYTGAHRDVQLSPEELAHVKTEIIQKLAAAYSLEKIREAIEEFRQQLGQLKDKQQQYY